VAVSAIVLIDDGAVTTLGWAIVAVIAVWCFVFLLTVAVCMAASDGDRQEITDGEWSERRVYPSRRKDEDGVPADRYVNRRGPFGF
jgi:hypothetical protein